MLQKLKTILTRTLIVTVCISSVVIAIISAIPVAKATNGSSGILGTNKALGSPILNDNFTVDDWNKWEIVCWGVFLSNFCQPLIDDYESAFKTTGYGSNGSGYKALSFSTGNDSANNETIEALCDYAITESLSGKKDIYVAFTPMTDGKLGEKPDPNVDDSSIRLATFKDFFFDDSEDSSKQGNTYLKKGTEFTIKSNSGNNNIDSPGTGLIPTFYIKNQSDQWVAIFDYTDSWDVQIPAAIVNGIRDGTDSSGKNYYTAFQSAFEDYWSSDPQATLDVFGNIKVDGKMLIPSATNKNLTKNKDINLMNSYIMNSYNATYSEQQLLLGLKQNVRKGWIYNADNGGYPAFGESNIGAVGLLYYDTDTILARNYLEGNSIDYGDVLLELFDCSISNSLQGDYTLKFEIAGNELSSGSSPMDKLNNLDGLGRTIVEASLLANALENGTSGRKILDYLESPQGDTAELFSSTPVIIASQYSLSTAAKEPTIYGAARNYYNFLYKMYTGKITDTTSGVLSKTSLTARLENATLSKFHGDLVDELYPMFRSVETKYSNTSSTFHRSTFDTSSIFDDNKTRLTLVYPVSEVMKSVSQILGVVDGTEFSSYSPYIYVTYLDWYGVLNQTTLTGGTEATSNFDTDIFDDSWDILNLDIGSVVDTKSSEQMETEVLSMSYLILHPEDGREYRKTLIMNGITDWIYETYNRIVYGGASSTSTTYSGSVSKSNSGFLAIETYSENWFVSFFLDKYVNIAVWLIAAISIAIIVVGIVESKKLSWFFMSFLLMINAVLLVPSSGDIVPYITSNFVQKMFADKMTYWSISQGITNASAEKDAATNDSSVSGLTDEEASLVVTLVKQLSTIYTDRSLMIKQDISQKVTQVTSTTYSDIQSLQSARWILPMVMQQYTGDNNSESYIYKSVANMWDDMSNMYWYFAPMDAFITNVQSPTATSGQGTGDAEATTTTDANGNETTTYTMTDTKLPSMSPSTMYSNLSNYFPDVNKDKNNLGEYDTDVNYHCYSYTLHGGAENQTHLSFYYLPDTGRVVNSRKSTISNYVDVDSWQTYIDNCTGGSRTARNFRTDKTGDMPYADGNTTDKTVSIGFEYTADTYDRTDRSTVTPDMPYLLSTESPAYYFYCVVKDSIDNSLTLGALIGQLQGQIQLDADNNEVRDNFMYASKSATSELNLGTTTTGLEYTGWTRDILDLEEVFTNMAPYLYQMQLMTGGFDGESGLLVDAMNDDEALTISDELNYYEGELQSWMYRCNWATKLMENPEYSEACTVRDSGGTEYTVKYPALPETYPSGRPMVFSEAQQNAMGLSDSDLNVVELKCVELNKKVAKQWTLLLNYAGTSGITKEVLMRQMATDATLLFCQEFSSTGWVDTTYELYPQSLDLRNISFDSVMKMLMLNVSKNTSYVYGDTMSTLISNSDIITSAILLLAAFICAYIIPLARTVLMGVIFYLGFYAVIRSIFSSGKYKAKVAGGQVITNVIFMLFTLIYYAVFAALTAITSSDEVLTTKSVQVNAGNPVWVLLIVIIAGGLYVFTMTKLFMILIRNKADMGFEFYAAKANEMVSAISDAVGSAGHKISSFFNSETDTTVNSTSNTKSISGTGRKDSEVQDVNIKKANKGTLTIEDNVEDSNTVFDDNYNTNYNNMEEVESADNATASEINATIEAGSKIEKES